MQASLPYRPWLREFDRGHWIHVMESSDQNQDASNSARTGGLLNLVSLIAAGSHGSPTGFVCPYG